MNSIYKYISKSFHLIQDCIWSSTRRSIWSNMIGFIFFAVQIWRVLCWFPISYHYHSIISAPGFPWPNPSIHIPPRKIHLAPNLLKWKKKTPQQDLTKNCVIWHIRKTSPIKAAGCFKMILDNARMGITRVFSEKQTHLTCILAKFHHPDGKSRNACVGASKQRFNKVEVKSLPRLSTKIWNDV